MGRPSKNPEHPLVRLRKALSTTTQQMTRAHFSRKVGIPETTIKAIESGTFKRKRLTNPTYQFAVDFAEVGG